MPKLLTRLRVPLGFLFAFYYLYIARPVSDRAFFNGLFLVAGGCLLRSWAAGYLLKGKRVAVGGPYAWIRNPLYVGSFIVGMGFCVAIWEWPLPFSKVLLFTTYFLGFGVVYRLKTLAEEKELADHLGDAYRRYAEQVPPFLPVKGKVSGLGVQTFSKELYKANREYECVLGCLGVLGFLFWRMIHAF